MTMEEGVGNAVTIECACPYLGEGEGHEEKNVNSNTSEYILMVKSKGTNEEKRWTP